MGTKKKTTPETKRRRSRSGVAGGAADRGRWSSKCKAEVVVRILKGEDLDAKIGEETMELELLNELVDLRFLNSVRLTRPDLYHRLLGLR